MADHSTPRPDAVGRDDLYAVASFLRELDRMLRPVLRGSEGEFQVHSWGSAPLPPTGVPGVGAAGARPTRPTAQWQSAPAAPPVPAPPGVPWVEQGEPGGPSPDAPMPAARPGSPSDSLAAGPASARPATGRGRAAFARPAPPTMPSVDARPDRTPGSALSSDRTLIPDGPLAQGGAVSRSTVSETTVSVSAVSESAVSESAVYQRVPVSRQPPGAVVAPPPASGPAPVTDEQSGGGVGPGAPVPPVGDASRAGPEAPWVPDADRFAVPGGDDIGTTRPPTRPRRVSRAGPGATGQRTGPPVPEHVRDLPQPPAAAALPGEPATHGGFGRVEMPPDGGRPPLPDEADLTGGAGLDSAGGPTSRDGTDRDTPGRGAAPDRAGDDEPDDTDDVAAEDAGRWRSPARPTATSRAEPREHLPPAVAARVENRVQRRFLDRSLGRM